ncbi:MAG: SDR family oxidoreductase [Flavobacteriales bacterium]|nr:SDR family oxidoreductase [Flavobacteriales bacterium]
MNPAQPFSLSGKTIVITGASSGIGQAIAISSAHQGAKLLLLGRDQERLNETLRLCENGEKHVTLSLDLQKSTEWIADFQAVAKSHAPIDGFVHAAGVSPTIPFKVMKAHQMMEAFDLNLFSAVHIIQILTKVGIKSSGGMSMVLISSVMSEVGEKGKSLYAMTKSALIGLVKSLALEYADKNIRFNAISASVVDTPLSMNSYYRKSEEALNEVLGQHPLGLGKPEDIGNSSVFLLSDASKWVTGTNLIIDGGYLAR